MARAGLSSFSLHLPDALGDPWFELEAGGKSVSGSFRQRPTLDLLDFPAEVGFELGAKVEPERFERAALGRRIEEHRNIEVAAGPRLAARNAAEQVDSGHTLLSALESSPEPFDRTGCVHGLNHA